MTAIRKITSEDRDFFIAASKAFYASAAVAHDVPASYHLTTFEELMNSEVYQSGYILAVDGASVGYALVSKTFSHEAGGTVWKNYISCPNTAAKAWDVRISILSKKPPPKTAFADCVWKSSPTTLARQNCTLT